MLKKVLIHIYNLCLFRIIERLIYNITGKKPWSIGYLAARNQIIENSINNSNFNVSVLPKMYGYGFDERVVEYPWIISNIPFKAKNILDAGSILNYGYILRSKKLRNKNILISNLNPEVENFNNSSVSYLYGVYGDLRKNIIKDNVFDVVVCGSVIEHIGMDNTKIYFKDNNFNENKVKDYIVVIKEFMRILKSGGQCLITVPYGQSSNHGWLQIFNRSMVEQIQKIFGVENSSVEYFKYNDFGWSKVSQSDSDDSIYFDVHKTKIFRNDKLAAAECVACIKLVKTK